MARTIKDAFGRGKAFIPFITAGDPNLDKTAEYILEMERAGADLIEIGIPFSDPIAEGVVIQEADLRALQSGTTTDGIFDMVEKLRQKTDMPLVFMGYLNPVFHYGYEKFFKRCAECGISGIIIPDLPYEEKGECDEIAASYGVDVISCFFDGGHRGPIRDQNRSDLNPFSGPRGVGYSRSSRLRNQYSGAGREDRAGRRRRDRGKRDRKNSGSLRGSCRTSYL